MNKRALGQWYRESTLDLLSRLGYATTRQVAKGVFGRCDSSTRQMSCRTLRRLLDDGYLVAKRDGNSINNEQLVALTKKGATAAAGGGSPLVAGKVHARDWLRHAHAHRTACNSVYVALPENQPVASELEVRAGRAPINKFKYRLDDEVFEKIPDLVTDTPFGLEWIEVENTWRSDKDLEKAVACMRALFWQPGGPVIRMHFVVTSPMAKSISTRLRKKMTHALDSGWPRQIREIDARVLSQHLRVSMLDAETLTLQDIPL